MGLFKPNKNTRRMLNNVFDEPVNDQRTFVQRGKQAAKAKVKETVEPKITRQPKGKKAAKLKPKEVVDPKKGHKDSRKPDEPKKGFFEW